MIPVKNLFYTYCFLYYISFLLLPLLTLLFRPFMMIDGYQNTRIQANLDLTTYLSALTE